MTRIILYSIFFLLIGFYAGKSFEHNKRNENFVDLYTTARMCMANLRAATGSLAGELEREREREQKQLIRVKSKQRKSI